MTQKIEYGYLGLGAAGSNIADAAAAYGVKNTAIMNAAKEDIVPIKMVPAERRFKVQGLEGSAKNRKSAFNAVKNDAKNIMNLIGTTLMSDVSNMDILIVVAAAGGGFGSGSLPIMCKLLRREYPNTIIVPAPILPGLYERGVNQSNALDCIRELSGEGFAVMPIDNDRWFDGDENTSIVQKYDELNALIVRNIASMLSTEKTSKYGNIDIADRLAMFKDSGVILIGSSTIDSSDEAPLLTGVQKAISRSPMSTDETSSVTRAMIQYECDKALYTEKNIAAAQGYFKKALGVFHGYYDADTITNGENGEKTIVNKVLVAFTGSEFSKQWIQERQSIADTITVSDKNVTDIDKNIIKSNKDLRDAWGTGTAVQAAGQTDNYDDLFADIEAKQ